MYLGFTWLLANLQSISWTFLLFYALIWCVHKPRSVYKLVLTQFDRYVTCLNSFSLRKINCTRKPSKSLLKNSKLLDWFLQWVCIDLQSFAFLTKNESLFHPLVTAAINMPAAPRAGRIDGSWKLGLPTEPGHLHLCRTTKAISPGAAIIPGPLLTSTWAIKRKQARAAGTGPQGLCLAIHHSVRLTAAPHAAASGHRSHRRTGHSLVLLHSGAQVNSPGRTFTLCRKEGLWHGGDSPVTIVPTLLHWWNNYVGSEPIHVPDLIRENRRVREDATELVMEGWATVLPAAADRSLTNGNELVKRCFSKSGSGTSHVTVTTLEHQLRLSGEPTSEPQQAPEEPSCPPMCQSRTCSMGVLPLHCFLWWKTEISMVLDLMPVTISSLNIHLSLSLS